MPISKYYTEVDVTTPAGTLQSNPLITQVSLGDVQLYGMKIRIPPGHSGQTGIQIKLADSAIIPWGDLSKFIIGNDDRLEFDYDEEVTSGLAIVTYNIGRYPHSHYLQFVNIPISQVMDTSTPVKVQVIT